MTVSATADFSDLCLCSNGLEDEQAVPNSKACIPLDYTDRSLEDVVQNRQKRSAEESPESWPFYRASRSQDAVKTIHLKSSFTPRLGRRVSGGRKNGANPQHVINLNAGSAFTPRLGRRVQNGAYP